MLNLTESISMVFNCFCAKTKEDEESKLDKKIYHVSKENRISVLPITPNFDIDNLYPITDHVELWNIFVVGIDKTYILSSVNDPHIRIVNSAELLNKKATGILTPDLTAFFDSVWDRTMIGGKQLQFYITWNGRLYFINTYPFLNGKHNVIGAILFMRAFDSMPETKYALIDGFNSNGPSTEETRQRPK